MGSARVSRVIAAVIAAATIALGLAVSAADRGDPATGRLGRLEPAAPVAAVFGPGELSEIYGDAMSELRDCLDERRRSVARAGGAAGNRLYC